MGASLNFADLVDAIDQLPSDDQQELLNLLQSRLAEGERRRVSDDIASARADFAAGKLKPQSVEQIMEEIEE